MTEKNIVLTRLYRGIRRMCINPHLKMRELDSSPGQCETHVCLLTSCSNPDFGLPGSRFGPQIHPWWVVGKGWVYGPDTHQSLTSEVGSPGESYLVPGSRREGGWDALTTLPNP